MLAAEKNKEDDFYAALWKQDEQVKAAREVAETAEQIKRNQETLDVLRIQVAAKEAQREAAKRVVELEAETMQQERELRRQVQFHTLVPVFTLNLRKRNSKRTIRPWLKRPIAVNWNAIESNVSDAS